MNPQDLDTIKTLVNVGLIVFAPAIAMLVQMIRNLWANSVSGELPRWSDVVLAITAFALSAFFTNRWHAYLGTDQAPSLLTDFWVQTVLLWIFATFSNTLMKGIYGTGRPPANADELRGQLSKVDPIVAAKAGVTMTDAKPGNGPGTSIAPIMLGLALFAFLSAVGCGAAHAQTRTYTDATGTVIVEPDSALFATWRLGGYVDVKAAELQRADGTIFTAFMPGAGVSYTWTTDLSTPAGLEVDPNSGAGWGNVGVRLRTYKGPSGLNLYLGADYVWVNDKAQEVLGFQANRHAELSIRLGAPVAKRKDDSTALFGIASVRWSPDERIVPILEDGSQGVPRRREPEYAIGLRWAAFGGR